MKRLVWILIALIIAVAALTRLTRLEVVPGSLYIDEVAILVDARSVADRGTDIHGNPWYQTIFPSYGDYKLPAYIWTTSGLMHLFGRDPWVVRLPSALAGIGSVIVIMLLAARFAEMFEFSKQRRIVFALAAGAVVALSPWSIQFSRTGFEAHVGQFLLLLSILSATYIPRWWAVVGTIIFGVLATYSYFSVFYVWVGTLSILLSVLGWRRVQERQSIKSILLTTALIVATYFALMLPLFNNNLYANMQQFRFSTKSLLTTNEHILRANEYRAQLDNSLPSKVFHREGFRVQILAEHMSAHFAPSYLFLSGDPYLRHGTGRHGLFLWPFVLPFVVGLFALARKQRALLLILAGWWFISVIPAALTYEYPHALRSLNGLGALSLIIAYGVAELHRSLKLLRNNHVLARSLVATALLIVSVSFIEYAWYYSRIYSERTRAEYWYGPYQEAAESVRKHVPAEQVLYVYWPADKWFLWYLAVFPEWYGAEIVSDNYHFSRIGQTRLFQPLEAEQPTEPVWILAQPSQFEDLQIGQTWQILESYPVSSPAAEAVIIQVKRNEQ